MIDRAVNTAFCNVMTLENRNYENSAATSLLGWWQDAGVDTAISEVPHNWLSATLPIKANVIASSAAPPASLVPQTLDALIDHLMTGDIPDAGPPKRRVRPTGDPLSTLMVLVDFPESADVESGQPLCDAIFDKMLGAVGFDRNSAYVALLCPGRPMTGRLSDDSVASLAVLARQHLALVSPKQLWLIGGAASRAILGVDDASARGKLHKVNQNGVIMDAIATAHPRMFEGSQSRKSAAWTEMQRLVAKEAV